MRARLTLALLSTLALLGFGASSAWAHTAADAENGSQPALAQTGYDFTPMLVTAAVVLLVAGATVLVAKYALARSSHS
ncbi:MAG: hypothetical protein Q7T71_01845 [Herbiconiux sp.]|nr:hypothetical protein [Herbiconiux sp.]